MVFFFLVHSVASIYKFVERHLYGRWNLSLTSKPQMRYFAVKVWSSFFFFFFSWYLFFKYNWMNKTAVIFQFIIKTHKLNPQFFFFFFVIVFLKQFFRFSFYPDWYQMLCYFILYDSQLCTLIIGVYVKMCMCSA